jgi:hypothetical protein
MEEFEAETLTAVAEAPTAEGELPTTIEPTSRSNAGLCRFTCRRAKTCPSPSYGRKMRKVSEDVTNGLSPRPLRGVHSPDLHRTFGHQARFPGVRAKLSFRRC